MAVASAPALPPRADLYPTTRKTRLPGGYMGKLLRVDLTTGRMEAVNMPEEPILRQFWGGQALGSYIVEGLAQGSRGADRLLVGASAVALLAVVTEAAFSLLERRLLPWNRH